MTARKSITTAFVFIVCAILINDVLPKVWECCWELAQSAAWLFVFCVISSQALKHTYCKTLNDKVLLAMASGILAFQSLTVIDEAYSAFVKYQYYGLPANIYYQKIDEGFDLYNGFYWLVLGSVWIVILITLLCALNWNGKKWGLND